MVEPGEIQTTGGNVEFLQQLQEIKKNINEFFENFALVEDSQLNSTQLSLWHRWIASERKKYF